MTKYRLRRLLWLLPCLGLLALQGGITRSDPPADQAVSTVQIQGLSASQAVSLTALYGPAGRGVAPAPPTTIAAQETTIPASIPEPPAPTTTVPNRRRTRPTTTTAPPPSPEPEVAETPVQEEPAPSGSSVWYRLANCESGGDWSINTGNGFEGGLQFTHSTWLANGGGEYANHAYDATASQQIATAEVLLSRTGGKYSRSWPACSRKLGLP